MIDPHISAILMKALTYGGCGALAAVVARFWGRKNPGPRYEEAAGVGLLVGAAFGAFFGFMEAVMVRG